MIIIVIVLIAIIWKHFYFLIYVLLGLIGAYLFVYLTDSSNNTIIKKLNNFVEVSFMSVIYVILSAVAMLIAMIMFQYAGVIVHAIIAFVLNVFIDFSKHPNWSVTIKIIDNSISSIPILIVSHLIVTFPSFGPNRKVWNVFYKTLMFFVLCGFAVMIALQPFLISEKEKDLFEYVIPSIVMAIGGIWGICHVVSDYKKGIENY